MIEITEQNREAIHRHAEAEYPHECCGLLIGRLAEDGSKAIVEVYPVSNARAEEDRHNRSLILPREYLRGERHAGERGLEVIGNYHSHPDHPAVPSQFDLDHAWPTWSYIIVSVREGRASELRSWEMAEDRSRFSEEEIAKGS